MESFNSLADEHQIDFSMDTKVSSLKIWADSDKLEKILFNLLSNAFKYTPQGKQIKVVVQEEEKDVILAVEDQGIGIAENKQKSLFVRFENLVDKNLFTGERIDRYAPRFHQHPEQTWRRELLQHQITERKRTLRRNR